jgi:hypothetical protein
VGEDGRKLQGISGSVCNQITHPMIALDSMTGTELFVEEHFVNIAFQGFYGTL